MKANTLKLKYSKGLEVLIFLEIVFDEYRAQVNLIIRFKELNPLFLKLNVVDITNIYNSKHETAE